MTSLPPASMVFNARSAGIASSTASTRPQRMPMSRLPRSDWLGSSTSPPLITRSNLSAGPIAASARPESASAAAEPVRLRKFRRDKADMMSAPPFMYSYGRMMRWPPVLRKSARMLPASGLLQDLIVEHRYDRAWPGVIRAHPQPGEGVGQDCAGLGIPDDDLKRVFRPADPCEHAIDRLIGAELPCESGFTAIATLNAASRYRLAGDCAGLDDGVASRCRKPLARLLRRLLQVLGIDRIGADHAA